MYSTQDKFNMLFEVKADIKSALEQREMNPTDDFTTYAEKILAIPTTAFPTENKIVEPSTSPQTIYPTSGYVIDEINVEAVTNEIDANIISENIKKGEIILGVTGNIEPLIQPERPGSNYFLVRFYDYDGTLLSREWVLSGEDATTPAIPVHTNLTFQGWNNPPVNITRNTDIAAIYTTTGGETRVLIELTPVSGKDLIVHLSKTDNSTLVLNWGDGSSEEIVGSGNLNTGPHAYADYGKYTITMQIISGTGQYSFGNGTNTTTFIGNGSQPYRDTLLEINIGSNVDTINSYAFYYCQSLNKISMPYPLSNINSFAFQRAHSLKFVAFPYGASTLGTYSFSYCYSLENIILSNSFSSIGSNAFYYCSGLDNIYIPNGLSVLNNSVFDYNSKLKSIELPSSVTSIGSLTFGNNLSYTKYILYSTIPPTLANTNAFSGITSVSKIYVPDLYVSDYKTATNWVYYANYIYPISDMEV